MLYPASAVLRGPLCRCYHCPVQTQSYIISTRDTLGDRPTLFSEPRYCAVTTALRLYLKRQLAGQEMAPWLRALPAPPEDGGPISSTYMEAHNHL